MQNSNPFVRKIGYIYAAHVRFIDSPELKGYTSFLPRKQTARSSLVWKNACVWPDKRRPVGAFA